MPKDLSLPIVDWAIGRMATLTRDEGLSWDEAFLQVKIERDHGEFAPGEHPCGETGCSYLAVQQDCFDALLCQDHLDEAFREEAGDRAYKWAKENRD